MRGAELRGSPAAAGRGRASSTSERHPPAPWGFRHGAPAQYGADSGLRDRWAAAPAGPWLACPVACPAPVVALHGSGDSSDLGGSSTARPLQMSAGDEQIDHRIENPTRCCLIRASRDSPPSPSPPLLPNALSRCSRCPRFPIASPPLLHTRLTPSQSRTRASGPRQEHSSHTKHSDNFTGGWIVQMMRGTGPNTVDARSMRFSLRHSNVELPE